MSFKLKQTRVEFDTGSGKTNVRIHVHPETGLLYHGWDQSKTQRWADLETGFSRHIGGELSVGKQWLW